jgi:hypothetical protein
MRRSISDASMASYFQDHEPGSASRQGGWRRLLKDTMGATDGQIVLGIQEVAPSEAMEMGRIMPEVLDQ